MNAPTSAGLTPPPPKNARLGIGREHEARLDYMLARYYEAGLARFVSTDPAAASSRPKAPQTWNRYAYARNNPLLNVDRDGQMDDSFLSDFRKQGAWANVPRGADSPAMTARLSVGASAVALVSGAAVSANLNIDNKGGSSITFDAQAKFGFGLEVQAGPSITIQSGTVNDIKSGEAVTGSGGVVGEYSASAPTDGSGVSRTVKGVGVGGSVTVDLGGPVVTVPITEPSSGEPTGQPQPEQQPQSSTVRPKPADPKQKDNK